MISPQGTPHISVDGYHIMITRKAGGFGVAIKAGYEKEHQWGKKTYPTVLAAKLGGFDALQYRVEKDVARMRAK